MKKLYKIVSLVFFMACFSICAYGAGTGKFLEGSRAEGKTLWIIGSSMEEQGGVGGQDAFEVTISGQEVPVTAVSTVRQSQVPVTVYCLVDVSGSIKEQQMEQIKAILTQLAVGLEDGDNMVIGTLGNQTETSGFLEKGQWEDAIGQLAAGHEDTNLYAGIVESIGVLKKDTQANPKKCLLILSDGQDDQKSGITQKEAETAVLESRIPVYTVAVMRDNLSGKEMDSQIEYGKLLGSFARMSVGGEHFAPLVDKSSEEEIAGAVLNSIKDSLVLNIDVTGISAKQDKLLLRVIYSSSDGKQYEDDMELYAEDLDLADEDTALETENAKEETTAMETAAESGEGEDPQKESKGVPVWGIAGIAAALIAVILGIVILKRKGQARKTEGEIKEEESSYIAEPYEEHETAEPVAEPMAETVAGSPVNPVKTYRLKLTAVGRVQFQREIVLEEGKKVTLGRNNKADIVLNNEDNKLSSSHCTITWTDGKLIIWDNQSTNDTFVNGVPIRKIGKVAVHEGDIIQLGSYEYRIG